MASTKQGTRTETFTGNSLRRAIRGLGAMNEHMIGRRVEELGKRSYKGETQAAGIDLAVSVIDLTTLEGADTPGRVSRLCAKAVRPDLEDPACPSVAAVCVYPDRVADAVRELRRLGGEHVQVASVAAGFPAGLVPLAARQAEIEAAVRAGATEIDTVLDRSAFLSGRYEQVLERVAEEKARCGKAKLKVILETAELGDLTSVWQAAWLAMWGGADTIKTSTGKGPGGATLNVAWVMAQAAVQGGAALGRPVGVKISGGVRSAKDALKHLAVAVDVMGPDGVHPGRYRIGASALLDDLVAQRTYHRTGRYHGGEYFPLG